jgi:hypothetical protein
MTSNPSLTKKEQLVSISVFVAAFIVIFPRIFVNDFSNASAIDNGWAWALDFFIAHKQHYRWGKDVLYTYGPLSFLSSRSVPGGYYIVQFLYDLYIVASYTLIFTLFLRTLQSFKSSLLFGIVLFFGMWEISFLMQVFNILAIGLMIDKKRYYWLSFFILLNTILSFYIKLNTFVFSLYSFLFLLALLAARRKYALLGILLLLFFALNSLLINFFNISLSDYLITAFDTVKYYSYSQYGFNPAYKAVLWYGIAVAITSLGLCLFFVLSGLNFKTDFFRILLIGNIALLIFLLFKQGFTRLDRGHYNEFLCLFPLILYCLYLNCPPYKRLIVPLIALSIVSYLFFSSVVLLKHYEGNTPLFSGPAPLKTYCAQLFGPGQNEFVQPAGPCHGSYDYYSNQCINQKDNLNPCWHNRPAFQSIVAVSPYLDSINAAYYLSANAPDTIFYDNLTVDDRNPLWDDPQCKWVIFTNYRYDYMDNLHQLVLTHQPAPLRITDSLLLDTAVTPGQSVEIPKNDTGIITMYAHVDYTAIGSIRTMLYQPPHVDLLLEHADAPLNSKPDDFRFVPALFNDRRLIINYSLSGGNNSSTEYQNDLTRDLLLHFNSIKPNIRSFSFQTDMAGGIRKKIRVKLYRTTINN